MKILLFNDNPVVRKLVTLSAQKTKDELSVIWSVEEIEGAGYDLLIIDDALYNDEVFESLKSTVAFKTTLLMATRGNAVPAGFDHVINKPFLPTDLVDLFARIDKDLGSKVADKTADTAEEIQLEPKEDLVEEMDENDSPLDLETLDEKDYLADEMGDLSDELGLDDFLEDVPSSEEEEKKPAILDHEEVQEVRGLLEDTEDEFSADEKTSDLEIDDFDFDELDIPEEKESAKEEEPFDFEGLGLEEEAEEDALAMEKSSPALPDEACDDEMLDEMELEDELAVDNSETVPDEEESSDDALSALDLKIRQAIGNLEPEDLDKELEDEEEFDFEGLGLDEEAEEDALAMVQSSPVLPDETGDDEILDEMDLEGEIGLEDDLLLEEETEAAVAPAEEPLVLSGEEILDEMELEDDTALEGDLLLEDDLLDDLELGEEEEAFDDALLEGLTSSEEELPSTMAEEFEGLEGFDELDMLDERELKLAIGEEVGDEADKSSGQSEYAPVDIEALDEVITRSSEAAVSAEAVPAEGVEALQALLKALANEDVAKSLKGLNISININFGNDK